MLNNKFSGGTCDGGFSFDVFKFGNEHGIVEESCNIYTAQDPKDKDKTYIKSCYNCNWDGCWEIPEN